MKLYLRKNVWYMDFTVPGHGRVQKSTGRNLKDRKSAERFMVQEYERILNRVQFGDKEGITLKDAFEITLAQIENEATFKQYSVVKRKMLGEGEWSQRWHLEPDMLLQELRQWHLDEHRSARRDEGLKPNSINVEVRVFRRVVNFAKKRHTGPQEELDFIQLPKFVKTRWLSDAEFDRILEELRAGDAKTPEGGYQKAMSLALFLRWTGMRIGEALTVDWAELDLSNGVAEFFREKTDTVSEIPLPKALIADLKARHNQPMPFMHMDWPIKLLRRAIDKVANGNPKIVRTRGKATIHTLRDTYATHLRNEGIALDELANLLGHSTEAMASKYGRIKGHRLREDVRNIIDREAS